MSSLDKALYKSMLKLHSKKILSFSTGIVMYEWLVTWVYPTIAKSPAVIEIANSFPTSVKSVFGVTSGDRQDSYEAYISAEFFGRIWTLIMAIYGVNTADALLAKLVEQGFMAFPLSALVTRTEIINTEIAVLLTGFAAMTGFTLLGVYSGIALFGVEINHWHYFRLGILGFSFFSAIGSYSLFFSALFNTEEQALTYSAAVTFIFFALDVVSGLDERFSWVQYITLFGLYRPQGVLEGTIVPTGQILGLAGIATLMFVLTGVVFSQKDIPV